ncbi:ATP-binding protein [Streptomyces alkaliterrae]|uniref:ATP-binding protein n=1 Tax=Streptomyces alkaliterrae TaxID=2213162 RepID=UPI003F68F55A
MPYGPMGVGLARRRMRAELRAGGAPDAVVDDAVLILSELLSNSCRHASPLAPDDSIRAHWRRSADGRLRIAVTDGGGPTRPAPAKPSVTSHGGRGLSIITTLAQEWGVEDNGDSEVTVWAVVGPQPPQPSISPHARLGSGGLAGMASLAPRGLAGRRRSTRGDGRRTAGTTGAADDLRAAGAAGDRRAAGAADERCRGYEAFDGEPGGRSERRGAGESVAGVTGVAGVEDVEGFDRIEGLDGFQGLDDINTLDVDGLEGVEGFDEVEGVDGGGLDGTAGRRG